MTGGFLESHLTSFPPQAKIENFALTNIMIIKPLFWGRQKDFVSITPI
jgi:hypothetical protein